LTIGAQLGNGVASLLTDVVEVGVAARLTVDVTLELVEDVLLVEVMTDREVDAAAMARLSVVDLGLVVVAVFVPPFFSATTAASVKLKTASKSNTKTLAADILGAPLSRFLYKAECTMNKHLRLGCR
jgi:hypothetical protein